jgi:hypothetical protein
MSFSWHYGKSNDAEVAGRRISMALHDPTLSVSENESRRTSRLIAIRSSSPFLNPAKFKILPLYVPNPTNLHRTI